MVVISQTFWNLIHWQNCLNLYSNFTEICSQGPTENKLVTATIKIVCVNMPVISYMYIWYTFLMIIIRIALIEL